MSTNQFLHEVGILILGGSACGLLQAYAPLQEPMKMVSLSAIALATIAYMAKVAGLI